jgi:hypothetical protein
MWAACANFVVQLSLEFNQGVHAMANPLIAALQAQQAAMLAALQCVNAMMALWLRMLKGEAEVLSFPAHRRAEEMHTQAPIVATGPAWSDHYGRRAHDVDVEHMR